jgi:hypothetical protein
MKVDWIGSMEPDEMLAHLMGKASNRSSLLGCYPPPADDRCFKTTGGVGLPGHSTTR